MNKKRILAATTAAAVTGLAGAPASAAVDQPVRMQADSFAELLQPIPNASEQLRTIDAQAAPDAPPRLIEAQYQTHHHHHHHNKHWYQQHGYTWLNGVWVLRPPHHHHHHHHNNPGPGPY
jgi:hypothetical protein